MANLPLWSWMGKAGNQQESRLQLQPGFGGRESSIRSEAFKIWNDFVGEARTQLQFCQTHHAAPSPRLDAIRETRDAGKAFALTMYGNVADCTKITMTVRLKMDSSLPYIECRRGEPSEGKDYNLPFRINAQGQLVLVTDADATAHSAAEYVLNSMLRDIRKSQ